MVDQRRLMMELYGQPEDQGMQDIQLPWLQEEGQQANPKTLSTKIQEWLGAREPNQGGITEDILSGRFQPTFDDTAGALRKSVATGEYTTGQDFADVRQKQLFDRLAVVKQLEQQRLKDQMDMMRFNETVRHNRASEDLSRDRMNSGAGGYTDPVTGEFIPNPNRKLTATEQKELFDTSDLVNASEGAKNALTQALSILNRGENEAQPYTGMTADARTFAARIPFLGDYIADRGRGAATTEYNTLITEQALNNLKAIFGGNPTEGERQVLLKMQALSTYNEEEQKVIIANAVAAADRRLKFNRNKASSIQTGNYGNLIPPASSGGDAGGLSPEEQQELEQLRARFGK